MAEFGSLLEKSCGAHGLNLHWSGVPRELSNLPLNVRNIAKGKKIFEDGAPARSVFFLCRGWVVKAAATREGGCQILDFLIGRGLLGFQTNSDGEYLYGARALSDVQLAELERAAFNRAVEEGQEAGRYVVAQIGEQLQRVHERLLNLASRSGLALVADLLLDLAKRARRPGQAGGPIELPITQSQLASAIGVTNVYLSRILQTLKHQGVLAWDKHGALTILNECALRRLV